jgi:hypothetical protein
VESVRALASELVRPLAQLRAVVLQASAIPGEVAVFLYENGRLSGPAGFSTLGMRIQNEQSGSTSLFAHPMAIEPIPETTGGRDQGSEISTAGTEPITATETMKGTGFSPYINPERTQGAIAPEGSSTENSPSTPTLSEAESSAPAKLARGMLEARMEAVLAELARPSDAISATLRQGHLALLKRWYYRTEARRTGEIYFSDAEGRWPVKAMLRGVGRIAGKMLTAGNCD